MAFGFGQLGEQDGFLPGLFVGRFTFDLEGFEGGTIPFDGALKVSRVTSETLQSFGCVDSGFGVGGGAIGRGGIELEFCEQSIFHRASADQAPAVAGDVVSEGLFDGADGGEGFTDLAAVKLVGLFFAGEAGVFARC
ncbi:MAG: hypothetical protein WBY44_10495 [Bryobacteraceae bacterium]